MIVKLAFSYPNDVPPSFKYFKPSIQRNACKFTNEFLKDHEIGIAIAKATRKAKMVHDDSQVSYELQK